MPKMKTHSGLKKRVRRTGTGKLKRGHAYTGHLKTNKTHKENKDLSKSAIPSSFNASMFVGEKLKYSFAFLFVIRSLYEFTSFTNSSLIKEAFGSIGWVGS